MRLEPDTLHELSRLAQAAALRAGRLIARRRGDFGQPEYKSESSSLAANIVTEVDRESQRIIVATLAPSLARNELGLLAEESADDGSRFEKDHFWCVDPLDGTLQFSENQPGFAVSIALVSRSGQSLIGVAHDPASGDLYTAVRGQGARKNHRRLHVPAPTNAHFTLTVDGGFLKHPDSERRLNAIRDRLRANGYPELRVVPVGGAVMNACYVLEHPPAIYLKFPKKEGGGSLWDYAATAAIFHESDASVTDLYGGPLELNRRESVSMNHRGLLYASDHEIAALFTNTTWP